MGKFVPAGNIESSFGKKIMEKKYKLTKIWLGNLFFLLLKLLNFSISIL
jgi:hypothetical protein